MPNIIYTISGYLYYYKILTILSINRILIKYRNDVKYNGHFEYCKIKKWAKSLCTITEINTLVILKIKKNNVYNIWHRT